MGVFVNMVMVVFPTHQVNVCVCVCVCCLPLVFGVRQPPILAQSEQKVDVRPVCLAYGDAW